MATLIISGGTTSAGLVAGNAADYQVISVLASASDGGAPGELDEFTVSNGGTVVGSGGILSVGTVSSGGVVKMYKQTRVTGITVLEGGEFNIAEGNVTLLGGNNIARGTWRNSPDAFTGSDGVISGVIINRGHFRLENGAYLYGVSLPTANQYLYVSAGAKVFEPVMTNANARLYAFSGAVISGGSMTAGLFLVSSGAVTEGITVSGGTIRVHAGASVSGISVIGANSLEISENDAVLLGVNRIAPGAWKNNTAAFTGNDGVISGAVLKQNLHIVDGAAFYGLTFDGGKYIYVSSGASLLAPSVTALAKVYIYDGGLVSGGSMTAGNVEVSSGGTALNFNVSGGMLAVRTGGVLSKGEVSAGGSITVGASGTIADITAHGESTFNVADHNAILWGVNRIDQGAWNGNAAAFTGTDDVISGAVIKMDIHIGGGAAFRAPTLNTNERGLKVSSGAAVYDPVIGNGARLFVYDGGRVSGGTLNAGLLTVSEGGLLSGVTANGGTIRVSQGASAGGIDAVGANTLDIYGSAFIFGANNIAAGAWKSNTAAFTGTDGVISGAVIKVNNISLGSGVSFRNVTWSAGYNLHISSGAAVYDPSVTANGAMYIYDSGLVSGGTVTAGKLYVSNGGVAEDVGLNGANAYVSVYEGGVVSNVGIGGNGRIYVYDGGVVSDIKVSTGLLLISSGASAAGIDTTEATILNTLRIDSGACLFGTNIITSNAWYQNAAAATGADGVISSVQVRVDDLSIGSGVSFRNVTWNGAYGLHVSSGAAVYSPTINNNGSMYVSGSATTDNVTIQGGGMLTVRKYGQAALLAVSAGAELNIDFTDALGGHGNTDAIITDWGTFDAAAKVTVSGLEDGYSYKIADAANANVTLDLAGTAWSVYDDVTVKSGEGFANAFSGKSYDFTNGTTLVLGTVTVATETGDASSLTSDDAIAGGRAVKWDSATAFTSGNVFLAGDMTSGQAWVELDGYAGGEGTTLYGAQGDTFSEGTVNINAKSGSLRNLAAGANAGGTVKAVNLFFAGAELDGTGYAGGFGNVTDEVKTQITTGTFAKDFYAGALANKLTTTTSVGNVSMTVAGGTFDGNIYGASAVKTDSAKGTGTRHTAGDVTLTVTGGSTTKGAQACIFAGGYATGTATGTVYTVASVTAEISGGNWGEAAGGRGVFGGIMASGVTAQVIGNVNITISGDETTMGNVYGGGWAQKSGAKSIVGDVNINIAGGTIANVFGGGSHSTTGGTTETGDVTITVSGGNITGAIYARGQLDGDATGAASVIFTGSDGFDCDVYGYSRVGGDDAGATLNFNGYTGEFSGALGGFTGITLDGATAMTLDTAASDVSNGKWEFDLTDRASTLAETSLLTWSSASFTDDTIKVTFADDTQAQGGWNIATVAEAFSGTTFDVEVDGTEIASGLAYNQQIASGNYAGWGFDLESGVLKFKQLA